VTGGSLEHLRAHRGVSAGVADEARAHGGELAVGVAADLVMHLEGVPLGVHADRLLAVEREAHGPPGELREQGSVHLDAEIFFAAEGAARRYERDAHALLREAERARDLGPVVEDALALGMDREPAVFARLGERALGLEKEVLDALGRERLAYDVGARCERCVDFAAPNHGA
jgi:hypothetical protein